MINEEFMSKQSQRRRQFLNFQRSDGDDHLVPRSHVKSTRIHLGVHTAYIKLHGELISGGSASNVYSYIPTN